MKSHATKERQKKNTHFLVLCTRAKEREREREMSSFGATTRAQKGRMGESDDLWDVIVNNDDICFKYILPRLNQTDVKFLFEVNTETRALIKRSGWEEVLKCPFEVEEMSSISTLEFAWNNVPWGTENDIGQVMDQACFCWQVARTNKLELLKWIREEKKCEWDARTTRAASYQGNLEILKYCVANKCPMNAGACGHAAANGNLECLKYLHEEAKAPWASGTAELAAEYGHVHILEYLVERNFNKYGIFDVSVSVCAAKNGHLDCLKFLHETAKWPCNNSNALLEAHENNHPECLQYLLDNDCPLPPGWRYEDGTLCTY